MERLKLKNGYEVKRIYITETNKVKDLCLKCSDYYILSGGELPEEDDAKEIFTELPPNKGSKDKFVLGIFNNINELIGIIDIVRNFPIESTWIIGLMLIEPKERGNGLGSEIHKELVNWLGNLGARVLRIGVIEENHKGIEFWTSLGYKKVNEIEMQFNLKKHIVCSMELNINENKVQNWRE
ncbi:GNAT family N-acetyltransferase [Clostridium neuense]|uniref:GNAT family N-acetyltransferase n=1 Tax=Clostridium neuense TaxID=1728934 RepID=A0ABW8TAJ5_9CLOT